MPRPKLRRPDAGAGAMAPRRARAGRSDPRFNVALARGVEILRAFRKGDVYLGNVELAERTGIPNSTVSRLTFTLAELGCLSYIDTIGKYQLAPGVLSLGYLLLANIEIHTIARPLMERIATESGGTIGLGVRDGTDMVYIEYAHGEKGMARNTSAGTRIPLGVTTMGWACLQRLPDAEQIEVFRLLQQRYGDDWPRLHKRIQQAFKELRQNGFCIGQGDYIPEANSVGAAFVHPAGNTVLALSCSGVRSALPKAELESTWGPRLAAMARHLAGQG